MNGVMAPARIAAEDARADFISAPTTAGMIDVSGPVVGAKLARVE